MRIAVQSRRCEISRFLKKGGFAAVFVLGFCAGAGGVAVGAGSLSEPGRKWLAALMETQAKIAAPDPNEQARAAMAEEFSDRAEREFSIYWDWCVQDAGPDFGPWLSASTLPTVAQEAMKKALAELGAAGKDLQSEFDRLASQTRFVEPERWFELYVRVGEARREIRLRNLRRQYPQWIFTKHYTLGGSHYAYTEGQSDAQDERHFSPGAALCRLDLEDGRVTTLLDDSDGVIRDPDVSWDGRRVLFSWKKSDREDDYHLYEMAIDDGSVKQLTHGLGFADYEGVYLPNDDILFNSTRCVQTVDCWWTEVSNLYTCDREGRHLRRLAFDQVHDNFPTVMPDGRIVYTRWEYSDRGQLFVQGLFQMNADGTGQTEYYGNESWFPTSLLHARGIPGTQKVVATFSGHHTLQVGKLGIVDPAKGRQENSGTQLIAPVREAVAERIDYWGQDGDLYQYPYPLSETEFVAACAPLGWARSPALFKIYWVAADGRREVLAGDPEICCSQPVPLGVRPKPPIRPSQVDYQQTTGTCFLQDVYYGPGLAGVPRGTIKKLRAIALEYRAAGVGWSCNRGPAGEALVCTPVSIGSGTWDAKTVLGEATVHPDGSAFFKLPARKPIYFQAIDEQGRAIQTMRSWLTLQPGESVSCIGCHESKNDAPPSTAGGPSMAMKAGPQELVPFHGQVRGFSYAREIQPILDRNCISCHNDTGKWRERLGRAASLASLRSDASSGAKAAKPTDANGKPIEIKPAFSLLDTPAVERLAKRQWSASYLALTRPTVDHLEGEDYLAGSSDSVVIWLIAQSEPPMMAPGAAGAVRSGLLAELAKDHYGIRLMPEELETFACWLDLQVPFCGDYEEANVWNDADKAKYAHFLEKRRRMEELERQGIVEGLK
ncbi:MAG: hypothetical protein ACM3VT_04355 [Solirubrobacterales bacterium]